MQEQLRKNGHCCALGVRFVKWGLGFFIAGLILGFGVLINYLVGSRYQTSNNFLSNMTLWFGSPLSLSVTYLQIGGLAMAIFGAVCISLEYFYHPNRAEAVDVSACPTSHKHGSLVLCNIGLIALFITGYIGYFVINSIWPGFYYRPIEAGKNWWLILQGLSILCFLIGVIIASSYICCCCKKKA